MDILFLQIIKKLIEEIEEIDKKEIEQEIDIGDEYFEGIFVFKKSDKYIEKFIEFFNEKIYFYYENDLKYILKKFKEENKMFDLKEKINEIKKMDNIYFLNMFKDIEYYSLDFLNIVNYENIYEIKNLYKNIFYKQFDNRFEFFNLNIFKNNFIDFNIKLFEILKYKYTENIEDKIDFKYILFLVKIIKKYIKLKNYEKEKEKEKEQDPQVGIQKEKYIKDMQDIQYLHNWDIYKNKSLIFLFNENELNYINNNTKKNDIEFITLGDFIKIFFNITNSNKNTNILEYNYEDMELNSFIYLKKKQLIYDFFIFYNNILIENYKIIKKQIIYINDYICQLLRITIYKYIKQQKIEKKNAKWKKKEILNILNSLIKKIYEYNKNVDEIKYINEKLHNLSVDMHNEVSDIENNDYDYKYIINLILKIDVKMDFIYDIEELYKKYLYISIKSNLIEKKKISNNNNIHIKIFNIVMESWWLKILSNDLIENMKKNLILSVINEIEKNFEEELKKTFLDLDDKNLEYKFGKFFNSFFILFFIIQKIECLRNLNFKNIINFGKKFIKKCNNKFIQILNNNNNQNIETFENFQKFQNFKNFENFYIKNISLIKIDLIYIENEILNFYYNFNNENNVYKYKLKDIKLFKEKETQVGGQKEKEKETQVGGQQEKEKENKIFTFRKYMLKSILNLFYTKNCFGLENNIYIHKNNYINNDGFDFIDDDKKKYFIL